MLARAFADDPEMVYLLPQPVHRRLVLPALMAAGLELVLRVGEVHVAAGRAAAAWVPPRAAGKLPAGPPGDGGLFAGVVQAMGPGATARMDEVSHEYARVRAEAMPGPHWYLTLLGVDPAAQGAGLGGLLVAGLLARAGGDALPAYVETAKETNVAFYRRYGFEVVYEGATPGGLVFWALAHRPGEAA